MINGWLNSNYATAIAAGVAVSQHNNNNGEEVRFLHYTLNSRIEPVHSMYAMQKTMYILYSKQLGCMRGGGGRGR